MFRIKWYKNLFLGESIKNEYKWLKYRITFGKMPCGYHCILLPADPENMMDIIRTEELRQKYYKKQQLTVIGLAGSKYEAFEVTAQIIETLYKETGAFELKKYLGYD